MTTQVATILQAKGPEIVTVRPDDRIETLARLLAEKRIGAVPVTDRVGALVGIVSERDVMRALATDPDILGRRIDSVMTREVKTCGLADTVLSLMEMMTSGRIRHVPVLDGGRLVGIVSIGDVVKQRLAEAQFELDALKSYISS
jgi:CBS domain-containing protein